MIEVEQVDAEEFELLELALTQAEQGYAASKGREPPPPAAPPVEPAAAVADPAALPASAASGKRKLPRSFLTRPTAAAGAAPRQQGLPVLRYSGPVQYVFTGVEVDELCQMLLASGTRHCGWDVEWRVTYQAGVTPRPVALVQLCFAEPPGYRCLLLHVARSGMTPHLHQLLCSKDIAKVGVGAHGDALKLRRDFGFAMEGVLDLDMFANMRLCRDGAPPQKRSLAGLVELLMQQTLEKAQELRCGDWEAFPLSAQQRKYAAADVFASLRVYEILEKMPVVWDPVAVPAGGVQPQLPDDAAAAGGLVPACARLAPLQPAKQQVYSQHMQQGLQPEQIAAARGIQVDTVQGYLAEAITGGYAYSWRRLGVPAATLRRVGDVAGSLLGHALACQEPREQPGCCGGGAAEGEAEGRQAGGGRAGAPGADAGEGVQPLSAGGRQGSGGAQPLGEGGSRANRAADARDTAWPPPPPQPQPPGAGGARGGGGGQPADVLQALLAAGHKMRELKEQHWEDIPYGHVRLALAHLGRCNPVPWA